MIKKRWKRLSRECQKHAVKYQWSNIAKQWDSVFREPVKDIKVTVYTPTIREGWWNIMSDNLSKQTYKNFEWIIVDDYREDRTQIAQKYAQKYNLDIKYIRGDKALGKHNRRLGSCKSKIILLGKMLMAN
ncbi:MAG: hypothetical protein KatS3mg101_0960 [Patescibacteria group bacterium]|nr:MAG: hypothetical protein KatS3mg101_0960 [Patescibacteria group bacterium]